MAVTNEGTAFPVPTGAVPPPAEVVEHTVPATNDPTQAVDGPPDAVTTKFGPSGQRPTGSVDVPESQTFQNLAVKVVNAPAKHAAKGSSTAETDDNGGR